MAEAARGRVDLVGRTVGNYRVARLLGAGAMGSVWLLQHVQLPNTFAALKVLKAGGSVQAAALKERFVQEALVAAVIGGDRVARPLDLGRFDDDTPYIIMELVDGQTLSTALELTPALPLVAALKIAWRVADTIALAHARGIVHRDLKPSNIMLVGALGDAQVKILDFGVARADGEIKLAQTLESAVIGSPGYMSPEAASGSAVDGRTDVFSLGVTLFKMLTGELPFPDVRRREGLVALLTRPAPSPSEKRPAALEPVPPSVDALMAAALAKDPAERLTMAALRDAIYDAIAALAPAEAALLKAKPAPRAPSLAPEIDQLGSTLTPDASPDLAKMREQVERFAATRVPPSTQKTPARRVWPVALAAVGVVLLAALGGVAALRARGRREAAPARAMAAVRPRQHQILFHPSIEDALVSPDGKRVAYLEHGTVHVQELGDDSVRDVALRGVDDLAWSGDSALTLSVGKVTYYEARLDALDKPTELPYRVGYFAFSPDRRRAAGGWTPRRELEIYDVAQKTTRKLQLSFPYTFLLGLEWSPTNDRFLVETERGPARTVSVISIDGKVQRPVLDVPVGATRWTTRGDGVLYIATGDNPDLMLVPLAADGSTGSARTVIGDLDAADFSLSADGKRMVYITMKARTTLSRVTLTGTPRADAIIDDSAPKGAFSVSPDGKRVAFTASDGRVLDVYTMPIAGGARHRLTHRGEGSVMALDWSPDGTQLAYRVVGDSELHIIDAATGAERKLLVLREASANDLQITWAPGARILYHSDGNRAIRALDPATGAMEPLGDDSVGWMFDPRYSPDARSVAVFWNRKGGRGLWAIDLATRAARLLTTDGAPRPIGWSADGKMVIAQPEKRDERPDTPLVQVPREGGAPRPLVTLPVRGPSVCRLDASAASGVCMSSERSAETWLVENFDELLRAAE